MKRIYSIFALIAVCAVFLTISNYFRDKAVEKSSTPPKPQNYLLIAEQETVNLYYGDILLKTYDGIVADSLPATDRDNLKSGIILKSYDEVMSIVEDFDG
ncbi:MAG: hypothetical protein E7526_04720 [Ruminococcaceae bacterium]|nr:hypothetical protein [Oscillospiraceae bacterium]